MKKTKIKMLKKLPIGVEMVKQDSYNGQRKIEGMYAAFTKCGRLITSTAGNNKIKSRKNVLKELNRQLKMVHLTFGNPTQQQIAEILN